MNFPLTFLVFLKQLPQCKNGILCASALHEAKLFLADDHLTSDSMVHYSLPGLHCMAHQLDSPKTTTFHDVAFILVDGDQYTSPPLFWHFLLQYVVEKLSKVGDSISTKAFLYLYWNVVRSHSFPILHLI